MAEGKKQRWFHSNPFVKSSDFFCGMELASAIHLLLDTFCGTQNYYRFFLELEGT